MVMIRSTRNTGCAGFTIVELLVVIAILGLLAIVMIPRLLMVHEKAVIKESMTNVMNIAGEVERHHAEGAASYSADGTDAACPAARTYTGNGTQVGALPIAVQGDYYAYQILSIDDDGDGVCECYRVTGFPVLAPATAEAPLTYSCHGAKTGPWR